jgi:hypothetical protein
MDRQLGEKPEVSDLFVGDSVMNYRTFLSDFAGGKPKAAILDDVPLDMQVQAIALYPLAK